ncbi:bestrophin family protein [Niabella drilacis]|uniref:Putative membrane protein n=1 Tax=Niabella drilacis (strain DSM 25811 / CCM 8410 / CCUG 62505 / LMG 26954 / E90) TaxID=1285928 RepID=A0A1G6SZ20_NIADE|nr:bestrophin family ion channel [Niabella drilacis]SDD21864.1 putative membrane protein [Niabella drilacis]
MTIYNSKEWFKSVFYLHKSDTFRKLFPYLILMALLSWGIAYLELEFLKLSEKSWLKNINMVHNLLGFALSLLLVFRTNTAYDRWWEARRQWGTLTNVCRLMAIKLDAFLPKEDKASRHFFRKSIPLFSQTLFGFLRSDYTTFMLDKAAHPELDLEKKHGPNQVASMIVRYVTGLYREGKISGDQLIVLNNELQSLTDVAGACERIKNTPIPYSYSSFIKKFIVVYVFTLPVGFVFSMGYFVVAAVPFIFYVLASLELIAESIENPFGTDADDLPLEQMVNNMKKHIQEVLHA